MGCVGEAGHGLGRTKTGVSIRILDSLFEGSEQLQNGSRSARREKAGVGR